jgi:cobalt-zinc-cadmium efflux system membrane fusion protein
MVRKAVVWIAVRLPTALTLALLAGLAVWGSRNDWKLPALHADPAEPGKESLARVKVISGTEANGSDEPSSPVARQARIEFPSADAVHAAGIEVVAVKNRDLSRYVIANGMLDYEPYRYAQLAARAPGTIWWVEKELGEPVHKGEVLALIDCADVGKAKADFLQSLALLEVRTAALDRLKSAAGAISGGNLSEAQANLRDARIRLFNDHQRLLNLNLSFRWEDVAKLAEDQQVKYLRLLGLPEKLRKELDPETLTANLLPLTAPFSGRLVRHPRAAPGEVVATNQPLFAVGDITELHIELEANREDVGLLALGQEVVFVPADLSAETRTGTDDKTTRIARGKLSHISPEVNEKSRRVQVHAELENRQELFRPNTYGTGRILVREQRGVPAVPTDAVQWEMRPEGRSHFVFVALSETSFQVRPVKMGLEDNGFIQVDGVQSGEMVVTTGSYVLKSELFKERIGSED